MSRPPNPLDAIPDEIELIDAELCDTATTPSRLNALLDERLSLTDLLHPLRRATPKELAKIARHAKHLLRELDDALAAGR